MLTAPMKLSSSLFGPRPRLGNAKGLVSELINNPSSLPAIISSVSLGSDPTLLQNNTPHMCSSAKTIRGRVLIHSL